MSDRSIQEAILHLSGNHNQDRVYMAPCTVTDVDIPSRTCTVLPIGGDAVTEIENVQLMGEVDDGMLLIPAIDSTVIVTYSTKNIPYISLYSQLQKVVMVGIDGIQFQGGELGGMAIVAKLVAQYNKLESAFNGLVALYNTHSHVANGSPTLSQDNTVLIPTQLTDIENQSVTHGS